MSRVLFTGLSVTVVLDVPVIELKEDDLVGERPRIDDVRGGQLAASAQDDPCDQDTVIMLSWF